MIHDCYSAPTPLTPNAFQLAINRLRIARKLRMLWPDHEVQDLLHSGISLTSLCRFTSAPITVVRIETPEQLFEGNVGEGPFTHVAVQRTSELDHQLKKKDIFFVVLAKRGLAVDEVASKFIRGNYIISAQVAQLDRQVCFWGVEAMSKERHIVTPKNISKGNSMWRVEFQSPDPVTNIFFYSTKREPRYGKASMHTDQLPKDAKLEICMKFRTFQSCMDGLMNKEQKILQNVPRFITPRKSQGIFFGSAKKENKKEEEAQQGKSEEVSLSKYRMKESLQKSKKANMKQLHQASTLQINNIENQSYIGLELRQVVQFLNQKQKKVQVLIENNKELTIEVNHPSKDCNLRSQDFDQLMYSLKQAQKHNQTDLRTYLIAILIYTFAQAQQRDIENWIQLLQHADTLPQNEQKSQVMKWIEALMLQYCFELLKDCDEDVFESLQRHKPLVMRGIQRELQTHSHQNSKISDLLCILMKLQGRKDVFDLYHHHQLTQNSLILTSSLKQWQQAHSLYLKNDADILYQTQATYPFVHYRHGNQGKSPQKETNAYDFGVIFSFDQFPNNSYFSGKQLSVGNHIFKCYITRKEGMIHCLVEKIEGLASENCEQAFTSFNIQLKMAFGNTAKIHDFGWSFSSPSHCVGYEFLFNNTDTNSRLQCKISFKRVIVHQSIMNYLRVRFEQLLKMHNKCSQRIETENKKLLKRRSSLFLQKNLYDDVNFCNTIEQECYLHYSCGKCEGLSQQSSIFKLSPADLYKLLLCASFKDELDALLVTIKYLILTPPQMSNQQFWLSQLRINHLKLQPLLQLINKKRLSEDTLKITCSLVYQKMGRKEQKLVFLHRNESRVGKGMWGREEDDYSNQYLQFLDNAHEGK